MLIDLKESLQYKSCYYMTSVQRYEVHVLSAAADNIIVYYTKVDCFIFPIQSFILKHRVSWLRKDIRWWEFLLLSQLFNVSIEVACCFLSSLIVSKISTICTPIILTNLCSALQEEQNLRCKSDVIACASFYVSFSEYVHQH